MMQELVEKAKAGDLEAFDQLVARFQDAVCGTVYGVVGSFDDAQDIGQEVFIQAWRDLSTLRDADRFPGWLHHIAQNRCRDFLRRTRREGKCIPGSLEAPSGGDSGDPAEEVARRESERRVRTVIGGLSKANRVTTMLFYINGYSIQEIAHFLEIPVGTVKRRLHESRKQLTRSVIQMVRESLDTDKPGPELRARILGELQTRQKHFSDMIGQVSGESHTGWARHWHERRLKDVCSNAAQYAIQPDQESQRMVPEYRMAMTFRDDFVDIPRRWGIPRDVELTNLRDLSRQWMVTPLSVNRWGQDGLPSIRYHPWVLYDKQRVAQWLQAKQSAPLQEMNAEEGRRPLLTVLAGLASGQATAEEAVCVSRKLSTGCEFLFGPRDPLWAEQWDVAHEQERQANAAAYGLKTPTPEEVGWLPFGIPAEDHDYVFEIRDLCRRLGVSPIDVVRWTRQGMPYLRHSPFVRWDIRRAGEWIAEQGLLPASFTPQDLDDIQLFVCRSVADGEATPDAGHGALSGFLGIM